MGHAQEELKDFLISYFKEQPVSELFNFAKIIIGPDPKTDSEFSKLNKYQCANLGDMTMNTREHLCFNATMAGAAAGATFPFKAIMDIIAALGDALKKIIDGDITIASSTRKVQEKIIESLNGRLHDPDTSPEEKARILKLLETIENHNERLEWVGKIIIVALIAALLYIASKYLQVLAI